MQPSDSTSERGLVLVTGAAGGIGREIVTGLLAAGHRVAATDVRGLDALHHAARDDAALVVAERDVGDPEATEAHVDELEAEVGALEGIVTAAGIRRTGDTTACALEDWARILHVDLTGTWIPVQAAVRRFETRGRGRVVTVSSEIGLSGASHYAA